MLRNHVLMQEAGGAGDVGGGAPDWFAALPDDIRSHESVANFAGKPIEELARQRIGDHGFISRSIRIPDEGAPDDVRDAFHEKLISVDGVVRMPNDDSSDEDRSAFFAKLGRPEAADKYEFTIPEDVKLPEGVDYAGGDLEAWFRENSFAQGLTQKQAATQWEGYVRMQAEALNAAAAKSAESERALRAEWGDRYDANMGSATATIEQLAKTVAKDKGAEFISELEQSGLGNHPVMARVFHEIGKHLLEDTALRDLANGGGEAAGLSQIDEQIAELQSSDAYQDGRHADHKRVTEKVNSLWKRKTELQGEPA